MKQTAFLIIIALVAFTVIFNGCCDECDVCDECPDPNETGIDPPYIESVTGPGHVTVGTAGDFSCSVLSDADIIRYSWGLHPGSGSGVDYYFPAPGASEGVWTPDGSRPTLFVPDDSSATVSASYLSRGVYSVMVEIEDADGYTERERTIVFIDPVEPDVCEDSLEMMAGMTDSIKGEDFEMLRFGMWTSEKAYGCSYADSLNTFNQFGYIESLDSTDGDEDQYFYTYAECGDMISVIGGKDNIAVVTVNFDIKGAMHIWDATASDYVKFSMYVSKTMQDSYPETQYLFSQTLSGDEPNPAYYFDSTREVVITTNFEGMMLFEFWVGAEIEIACSGGAGGAVCFDGDDAYIRINKVTIDFN